MWKDVAYYTLGAGIVGALLAAGPGFIDFFTITDARNRQTAIAHMAANLVALAIFGASFWLRWVKTVGFLPVGFSIAGLILLGIAGWLGGELVYIHNLGVTPPKQQGREPRTGSRRRAA